VNPRDSRPVLPHGEHVSQEDNPRSGWARQRPALEVSPALTGPARRKTRAPFV